MGLTQPSHLIILIAIIVLLFGGATRLPEFGRALGSGMREFKDAVSGNSSSDDQQRELPPAEQTVAPTTATPTERETL
jgi:sec-independent protein translocase protein TatA